MNKISFSYIVREIIDLFANWFSSNEKTYALCPVKYD